jgi:hypothetical protein
LIDGNPAIPPLQVVQVLSQSKELPVSVVKQYIANQLLHDEKQIEEDEEKILAFKSHTNQMKEEIAQLNSKAVVFQATKCDLCNHDLNLPAVFSNSKIVNSLTIYYSIHKSIFSWTLLHFCLILCI